MPNMDDLWLTVMHPALDPRTAGGPPLLPPAPPSSSGGLAADPDDPAPPEKDGAGQT